MTLKIINGTKYLDQKLILEHVNLNFENSNIYGLQGDNGSGKTVVLKLLAGYIHLDKGEITQDGRHYHSKKSYIKNAGIVIEKMDFLPYLTLKENLQLLKWLTSKVTDEKIAKWITYYRLSKFENTKFKHLSLGTKQKLALIQAFIHQPDILLLDEPMNGLDEKSVELTKKVILSHRDKGGLVILTSHISENISDLCNKTFIIRDGQVISQ